MKMREIKRDGFHWIDIFEPQAEDLQKLAEEYHLDPQTIKDCLEPEHLPKYELFDNISFIILRAYDIASDKKSDTVQKITNKIAMFFSKEILITVHRQDQPFVNEIFDRILAKPEAQKISTHSVANTLMYRVARTYELGLDTIYDLFESFEQDVFNKTKKMSLVQSYLLKRRIDIMGRMLTLMKGPVLGLMTSAPANCRSDFQDTKEFLDKVHYQTEVIHDNLTSLLSLQVALASQNTNEASLKTSEVMRVLTIISIFFMPLNFIVGFYGMNFENLPLLHSAWGYIIVTVLMIATSSATYLWLRSKRIIKSLKT